MPPKGKPRIWCGMPIPVRVGFLPGEEGRPPGKGTTAHRLAVVPCIGRRRRPFPIRAGKGRWGGLFNRPTGFFSRYPYLAEKPEIPRQGDSREGNEHPFELPDP